MGPDSRFWITKVALFTLVLAACFALFPQVIAQGTFTGFVPISADPGHVVQTANGVDVTMTFHAQDGNGNDIYTTAPVSMTEAEVAQRMRDSVDNPNMQPGGCGTLEGLGYVCNPGEADPITSPGDPPNPDYAATGTCKHTNPNTYQGNDNYNADVGTCYANQVAATQATWGSNAGPVTMECDGALGITFRFTISGSPFQAGQLASAWTPAEYSDICPNAGDPLPDPPEEGEPTPDPTLFEIATNSFTQNTFIRNNSFYSNTTNNSWNTTFAPISTTITNLNNTYSTATGATEAGGLPDGFGYTPGSVGGDDGTNPGSTGSGTSGSGEGGQVNCDVYPNSLGCQDPEDDSLGFLDGLLDGIGIEPTVTQDIGEGFTPTALPGQGAGSCPADVNIPFMSGSVDVTYEPLCDAATTFRPLVLAIAALIGLYILVGYKSAGI